MFLKKFINVEVYDTFMGMGSLFFGVFVFFFVMGGIIGDQALSHIPNIFIYAGMVLGLFVTMLVKLLTKLIGA